MENEIKKSCCGCGSDCCLPKQEKKKIAIDFLYLDLDVCGRCQGTEKNLDEAIKEVSGVLKAANFDVLINKVHIATRELAHKYKFLSSPTIRIDDSDIELDVYESACKDCGDLCGENLDCRVFEYEGVKYDSPPKAMIVNAVLKHIYGGGNADIEQKGEYKMPKNLEMFFDGLEKKKQG